MEIKKKLTEKKLVYRIKVHNPFWNEMANFLIALPFAAIPVFLMFTGGLQGGVLGFFSLGYILLVAIIVKMTIKQIEKGELKDLKTGDIDKIKENFHYGRL